MNIHTSIQIMKMNQENYAEFRTTENYSHDFEIAVDNVDFEIVFFFSSRCTCFEC